MVNNYSNNKTYKSSLIEMEDFNKMGALSLSQAGE